MLGNIIKNKSRNRIGNTNGFKDLILILILLKLKIKKANSIKLFNNSNFKVNKKTIVKTIVPNFILVI